MYRICIFELRLRINIDTYADYDVRQKLNTTIGLALLVFSITVPDVIIRRPA